LTQPKQRFADSTEPGPAIEPLFTVLAASKIVGPEYGTRCSTVLMLESNGAGYLAERRFDAQLQGRIGGEQWLGRRVHPPNGGLQRDATGDAFKGSRNMSRDRGCQNHGREHSGGLTDAG
jgi:hypothetical protein